MKKPKLHKGPQTACPKCKDRLGLMGIEAAFAAAFGKKK